MSNLVGSAAGGGAVDDALALIRTHLEKVRFGSVALTIHEGRIVQLDLTEKRRLAR